MPTEFVLQGPFLKPCKNNISSAYPSLGAGNKPYLFSFSCKMREKFIVIKVSKMKKTLSLILSVLILLCLGACSAGGAEREKSAVIDGIESYFNEYPESSAVLLELVPFNSDSLGYDDMLRYTCERTSEMYKSGSQQTKKRYAEKNTLYIQDVKDNLKEFFGCEFSEKKSGSIVKIDGETLTFKKSAVSYKPVFSLENISFDGNGECVADFSVMRIRKSPSKTDKTEISVRFGYSLSGSRLEGVRLIGVEPRDK